MTRHGDITKVDAIVVGAGPAGLAAALTLVDAQLSVLLLDEQPQPGGQVWRNSKRIGDAKGLLSQSYKNASVVLDALAHSSVMHRSGATVIDASANGSRVTVTWLSRQADGKGQIVESAARALIVATGAQERAIAFPGAELPGVMGVGAVQTAIKQGGLVPRGTGIVLAGQGPLLLLTLSQIVAFGGNVDAILDLTPPGVMRRSLRYLPSAMMADPAILAEGLRLLVSAARSGVPYYRAISRLRAEGKSHVERLLFEAGGRSKTLPCKLLAVHDGVIPNTQLTRLLDIPHIWDEPQAAFRPQLDDNGRAGVLPVWVAGDGAGIAGAEIASLRGKLAGLDVISAVRPAEKTDDSAALRRSISKRLLSRRFIDAAYPPLPVVAHADANTQICRCEAVTVSDIKSAISNGANGPNRVKAFTRSGMGPCQGRICGNLVTRVIANETKVAPHDVGALRIRPPLKPVLVRDYLTGHESAESAR